MNAGDIDDATRNTDSLFVTGVDVSCFRILFLTQAKMLRSIGDVNREDLVGKNIGCI